MPIAYTIDAARKLIVTRAWGVLNDEDLLQHKARLARDPLVTPDMRELSDVRGIEQLAVTPKGVRALVSHDDARFADGKQHRLAIIVPNDEVFGMARMYQTLGNDQPVRIFRDPALAEAWLLEGL